MSTAAATLADQPYLAPPLSIEADVRAIALAELAPLASVIDEGTIYPAAVLRRFGAAGAWSSHWPTDGAANLRCAISRSDRSPKSVAPLPSWLGVRARCPGTSPIPTMPRWSRASSLASAVERFLSVPGCPIRSRVSSASRP